MNRLIIVASLIVFTSSIAMAQIEWQERTIDSDFYGAWNVYAIDLDQDGDVDVLGASHDGNEVTWWENDGSQNFSEHTLDSNFGGSLSIYAIDMDGDNDIDVTAAAYFADEIAWWENDGHQNFTKHVISSEYYGVLDVFAIDMDNDSDIDVVGATLDGGDVTWWENDGAQDFLIHPIDDDFYGARSIAAYDLDQDGDIDVMGAAEFVNELSWWENDGSQNFSKRVIEADYNAFWVYPFDLDLDNDIDILGCAAGQHDVSWWENDGEEVFLRHIIDANFPGAQAVHADDLDSDGDIDILGVARYTNELAWWENDGDLNFLKYDIRLDYYYPTSVFSSDLDGDGDLDVLATAFELDNVSWWENLFEVPTELTIAIADVYGENGLPVSVPVYAYGLQDQPIAGIEFHMAYNDVCLEFTGVSSDYLTDPLVNVADGVIHLLWEDYQNPVSVPDSANIIDLDFTVLGGLGDSCPVQWTGNNELVNPEGEIIPDLDWLDGSVFVVEFHDIGGNIIYYDLTTPVPDVTVDLSGDYEQAVISDGNGAYIFEDIVPGNFVICPSRPDDDAGVTVTDVVLIRRHIVWLETFDSPYKMIAADVNSSGGVTVADVVKMRRYLADLEELPRGNWAFVDSSFAIDSSNWADAPGCIEATLWDMDLTDSSFVGVRMGDVDYSWSQGRRGIVPPKVTDTAVLDLADCFGLPGDTVYMPVNVAGFDGVAGLEMHFEYPDDGMRFIDIASDIVDGPTTNGHDGAIHFVWEDIFDVVHLADGEEIVYISFEILEGAEDSMMVSFSAAYVVDEEGLDFAVESSDGYVLQQQTPYNEDGAVIPKFYRLGQNYPNPFNARTGINFDLPRSSDVSIGIYDMLGRRVATLTHGFLDAGYHRIVWDAADQPSGIYFYKIKAGDFVDSKKMLLLK